jgi:DNA-binding NtrC family response regulator
MALARVLIVDDVEAIRTSLKAILEQNGFEVVCADGVPEALACIAVAKFDVLVSDLHMPGAGDGLTVVSAMRHSNPDAVTMLLSSFPQMSAAANAILLQTDEILVKPMKVLDLIDAIRQRLAKVRSTSGRWRRWRRFLSDRPRTASTTGTRRWRRKRI